MSLTTNSSRVVSRLGHSNLKFGGTAGTKNGLVLGGFCRKRCSWRVMLSASPSLWHNKRIHSKNSETIIKIKLKCLNIQVFPSTPSLSEPLECWASDCLMKTVFWKDQKLGSELNFTINCDGGCLFTKIQRLHFSSQRQTVGVNSIQIWGRTVGKNVVTCAANHLADSTIKRQKLIGHTNRNITGQTHLPDVTLSSPTSEN